MCQNAISYKTSARYEYELLKSQWLYCWLNIAGIQRLERKEIDPDEQEGEVWL
jgi:hypothetical protein